MQSVSRRKATVATLAGNTANLVIVSLQALILIPLYLHTIGPSVYGAWLGSGDILTWMQVFDLGLPNLMIQRIGAAHGRGDSKTVAEYFATGTVALVAIALIGFGIGLVLAFPLPRWMGLVGDEAQLLRDCFIVGLGATTALILSNSVIGFARGIQNTLFMNVTVIVAGVISFVTSVSFIWLGWGLWAIVMGLVARTVVTLAGSILFTVLALRKNYLHFFRVRVPILKEFAEILPITALGGLSYVLMNQSELALIAIFARPELAAMFNLTRKAVDLARGLTDMIGTATYGSFAHLVTSDQRHRALRVHAEVHALRLSLAILIATAYMIVNSSLVALWVGSDQYGGSLLTILIAIQFIVVGSSYLMNYLYRATGAVKVGASALLLEAMIRVPLMIGLLYWWGMGGIPVASILTAGLFLWLIQRRTDKSVAPYAEPAPQPSYPVWMVRITILLLGVLLCTYVHYASWAFVLGVGFAVIGLGGLVLLWVDPLLSEIRLSSQTAAKSLFLYDPFSLFVRRNHQSRVTK